MSLGGMADQRFAELLHENGGSEHPAGCTYGGFSCGYWLINEDCELDHWERHIVLGTGKCPCETEFPGAANEVVFVRLEDGP